MTRRAEAAPDDGLFSGIGRVLVLGAVTLAGLLALLVQMAPLGLAPRSQARPLTLRPWTDRQATASRRSPNTGRRSDDRRRAGLLDLS